MSKEIKFKPCEWLTPNTYGNNYSQPPQLPGVYVISVFKFNLKTHLEFFEILYIGSSKNLYNRWNHHSILDKIRDQVYSNRKTQPIYLEHCGFYFLESDDFKNLEARLIQKYKPPFNKQYPKIKEVVCH